MVFQIAGQRDLIDVKATEFLLDPRLLGFSQDTIRRNCFLLSPSKYKEILGSEKKIGAVPIFKMVSHFSTLQKMSILLQITHPEILFRKFGISQKEKVEGLLNFKKEVGELTFGVITAHTLNHLNTLQMLLLAEWSRCRSSVKDDILQKKVENAQRNLEGAFIFLDEFLISYQNFKEACECLAKFKKRVTEIHLFQVSLHQDTINTKKLFQILSLFETSLTDPFLYFPLLLGPLDKRKERCLADFDSETVNPKEAAKWLTDFEKACQLEYESFFVSFKKSLEREQTKFTNFFPPLIAAKDALLILQREFAESIRMALLKLNQLEASPLGKAAEWEPLEQLCEQLKKRIVVFRGQYWALKENIEKVIPGRAETEAAQTCLEGSIIFPTNQFVHLSSEILHCLIFSCRRERRFRDGITKSLLPRFREIDQMTLVPLFQMQTTQSFLEISPFVTNPAEREELNRMHADLDLIWSHLGYFYFRRCANGRADTRLPERTGNWARICFKVANNAKALLKRTQEEKFKEFLVSLESFASFLYFAVGTERWPQAFVKSPYAKSPPDQEFFYQLLEVHRRRILELNFEQSCQSLRKALQNFAEYQKYASKIVRLLDGLQAKVKKAKTPTFATFKEDAVAYTNAIHHFFIKIRELREEVYLTFSEEEEAHPESVQTFTSLRKEFADFFIFIFSLYIFCEPLTNYLYINGLVVEEEKKKPQKVEPKIEPEVVKKSPLVSVSQPFQLTVSVPPPIAPSQPLQTTVAVPSPVAPQLILGAFEDLKSRCQALIPFCSGFTAVAQPLQNGLSNEEHQSEHLQNLVESVEALEELDSILPTLGDRPPVIVQLNLKLAVALEQAAKLAVALRHIPVPEREKGAVFLENKGRESLWKEHAPHLFVRLLQLELSTEQTKLLQQMEKVIAISSRYPASGRDALTQDVEKLFQLESDFTPEDQPRMRALQCKLAERKLKTGIETILKIVQSTKFEGSPQAVVQPIFHLVPLDQITPVVLEEKLHRLERKLKRIQNKHLYHSHVTKINNNEETVEKRKGTIWVALQDLSISLCLLKECMDLPNAPLVAAEEILLCESVIFERVFLLFLALLPLSSSENPSIHYLWGREGGTLRRNSHALGKFLEKLSHELPAELVQRMEKHVNRLESYLKRFYRYQGEGTSFLDSFKTVSQLRLQLLKNQLTQAQGEVLDAALAVGSPEERLAKLEAYSERLLHIQILQPCFESLTIVEELLDHCIKFIVR